MAQFQFVFVTILVAAISVPVLTDLPRGGSRYELRSRQSTGFLSRQASDSTVVTPYPSADALKPEVPFDDAPTERSIVPDEVYGAPDQAFNVPDLVYGPADQAFNVPDLVYGPADQAFNVPEPTYGPPEQAFNESNLIYGAPENNQNGLPVKEDTAAEPFPAPLDNTQARLVAVRRASVRQSQQAAKARSVQTIKYRIAARRNA